MQLTSIKVEAVTCTQDYSSVGKDDFHPPLKNENQLLALMLKEGPIFQMSGRVHDESLHALGSPLVGDSLVFVSLFSALAGNWFSLASSNNTNRIVIGRLSEELPHLDSKGLGDLQNACQRGGLHATLNLGEITLC